MADPKEIEKLLDRYFKGETSTEEEQALRKFFTDGEFPRQMKAEAELFRFFDRERSGALPEDLEQRLDSLLPARGSGRSFLHVNRRYYWISGLAAAILILAGIFIDLKIRKNSPVTVMVDTYEDPYLAYEEAKKVIYMVSEKMNTAKEPLKKLEKLGAGVNYMQPVLSFGEGIQYLGQFSRIDETRKIISK